MIGVFDSGAGGLAALGELRRIAPNEDVIFLADAKNAPYGTKAPETIAQLARNNILRLIDAGSNKILIACCTASACFGLLDESVQSMAVPIIAPTAREAVNATRVGAIAVIATDLTVKLRAFSKAIKAISPSVEVCEVAAQPLVSIAEKKALGGALSKDDIRVLASVLDTALSNGADTLVLGCTHFSYFEEEIKKQRNINTVDSAKVGARSIANAAARGRGTTLFLK